VNYNILILHAIDDFEQERNTSVGYVTALERYTSGHRFVYHHVNHEVTEELRSIAFDIVWLDVTFLCWRWVRPREEFDRIRAKYRWVGEMNAFRVAFPQDDYDHTNNLDQWLAELGTDCIYSCYPDRAGILYPRALAAGASAAPSLTGFIDEADIETYARLQQPFAKRSLDVGYRVRRIAPNYGRFGILKSEFGRKFAAAAAGRLNVDISDDPKATLLGDAWPAFLGNCRYILGCEGGVSVIDRTGELKDRVDAFVLAHPEADWEDIYQNCIGAELEIPPMAAISPRIFEIAMAGACPVLVEGEYGGLLQPERDYIPVRRDLSNLDEVVGRLADEKHAKHIASNAKRALLDNPTLRFGTWIKGVMQRAETALSQRADRKRTDQEEFHRLFTGHHRKALSGLSSQHRRIVQTYERELKRFNEAVAPSYRNHVESLTEAIGQQSAEFATTLTTLEGEIKRLTKENQAQAAEFRKTVATLETEIKRLSKAQQLQTVESHKVIATLEADNKRLALASQQQEAESAKTAKTLEAEIKRLLKANQQQAAQSEKTIGTLQAEIERLSTASAESARTVATLEAEIERLAKENKRHATETRKTVATLEADNKRLAIASEQQEVEAAKTAQTLETEIKRLLKANQQQAAQSGKTIGTLQAEIERLSTASAETARTITTLEAEIERLAKEDKRHATETRKTVVTLEADNKRLAMASQQQEAESAKTVKTLETEIKRLFAENQQQAAQSEKTIAALQAEIQRLSTASAESARAIATLEAEIERQAKENKRHVTETRKTVAMLEADNRRLAIASEQQETEAAKTAKTLEAEISHLHAIYSAAVSDLKATATAYEREIERLNMAYSVQIASLQAGVPAPAEEQDPIPAPKTVAGGH
jgi:predicted RNase H-like nuclease (RuvC/YqgF family)